MAHIAAQEPPWVVASQQRPAMLLFRLRRNKTKSLDRVSFKIKAKAAIMKRVVREKLMRSAMLRQGKSYPPMSTREVQTEESFIQDPKPSMDSFEMLYLQAEEEYRVAKEALSEEIGIIPPKEILSKKHPKVYLQLAPLRGRAERLAVATSGVQKFIEDNITAADQFVSVWDGEAHGPFSSPEEALAAAREGASRHPCIPMTWQPNAAEEKSEQHNAHGVKLRGPHFRTRKMSDLFDEGSAEEREFFKRDGRPGTKLILQSGLNSEDLVEPAPIAVFDTGCQHAMILSESIFYCAAPVDNVCAPTSVRGFQGASGAMLGVKSKVKVQPFHAGEAHVTHPEPLPFREVEATGLREWPHPYMAIGPKALFGHEDFVLRSDGGSFILPK